MKKYILSIIAVIVALAVALTVLINSKELFRGVIGRNLDTRKTVIVDAGHGGLTNTIN